MIFCLRSQSEDDIVAKLVAHDKLMTENVDIRTQLKATELERDRFHAEVARVSTEISLPYTMLDSSF